MRLIRTRRKPRCEVNLTPLIDVVLLLIIFSMVVSQFKRLQAEDLKLPEAHAWQSPAAATSGRIVVNVLADGRMVVFGREHTLDSLAALLAGEADRVGAPAVRVVIRGDRRSDWPHASAVLTRCARLGIRNVKVAVIPPDSAPPGP